MAVKPSQPLPTVEQAAVQPKSIVLFSDGTGNSSGKLFKTNVWRMYEAVDLGPSPSDKRDQISFYDDGVGTSGFKLLAALGGAFGWGLKRNVLDLYRYACRNFREGDEIFGFGFSRGAFTMRLVVALIASEGLVRSEDESELDWNSHCAYRSFRASFTPRKFKWLTLKLRRIRDVWVARRERRRGQRPYRREDNCPANIRFVGVWDTVAAYGGPIAETTRAIDNWFYPLSMPDYELSEQVECARHALALDDERDAFHPLLWDELAEERREREARHLQLLALQEAQRATSYEMRKSFLAEAMRHASRKRHFRNRMRQVWFTGMHADVGGGYPDESLSYVSLLWMMEEAEKAGLRTLDSIKDRFFALANSYGPMHDSRSGIGAYYRYQPRKIAAWLDPPDNRSLMLRDPAIRDAEGNEHGLLRRVHVHESVIARINTGTVRYAPISLPESFEIVPPQLRGEKILQPVSNEGETATQAYSDEGKKRNARTPSEPLIGSETRERLRQAATGRFTCQENLWDLVWRRRIAYFATLSVTILILALPFWNPLHFLDQTCADSRCVLPSLIRSANVLVPGFAEGWIEAIALYPITAIILALAVMALLRWSTSIEVRLWNGSFRLWRKALDGKVFDPNDCHETPLRLFREKTAYQKFFRYSKWYFLPGLFGLLMVGVIFYVPLVVLTQMSIQFEEASHALCPSEKTADIRRFYRARFNFDARRTCVAPPILVEKGQAYEIVFQLPVTNGEPVPWLDRDIAAKPGSLTRVRASSLGQLLGMPMRRVIEASYLQPLAQITKVENPWPSWLPGWVSDHLPELDRTNITELNLKQDDEWPELYRVRYSPNYTGSLHLFSNDSRLPFGAGRWLYDNNCGVALVTITRILARRRDVPAQELMTEPGEPIAVPLCAHDYLQRHQAEQAR